MKTDKDHCPWATRGGGEHHKAVNTWEERGRGVGGGVEVGKHHSAVNTWVKREGVVMFHFSAI